MALEVDCGSPAVLEALREPSTSRFLIPEDSGRFVRLRHADWSFPAEDSS